MRWGLLAGVLGMLAFAAPAMALPSLGTVSTSAGGVHYDGIAGGERLFVHATGSTVTFADNEGRIATTDPLCSASGRTATCAIPAGAGALWIDAGPGDDRITYTGTRPASIFGAEGNDILIGGAGDDFIQGDGGADLVSGNGGDDRLHGFDGQFSAGRSIVNDAVCCVVVDPTLKDGPDRLFGGDGDDWLDSWGGGTDPDVDCGPGADRLYGDLSDAIRACEAFTAFRPT